MRCAWIAWLVVVVACTTPRATATKPAPIAAPRPSIVVPRSAPAAIAAWDVAWQRLRGCLIPVEVAVFDPRDAIALASKRERAEVDGCIQFDTLAAAVPPEQTRLAAAVAMLAPIWKTTETASEDRRDDVDRERLGNVVRDVDDLTLAMHAAADMPSAPVFGTTRVPLGTYTNTTKPEIRNAVSGWIEKEFPVEHEVRAGDFLVDGPGFVEERSTSDSEILAPSGTWRLRPGRRGSDETGYMVVLRDGKPDVTIEDTAHEARLIGDGDRRVIVYLAASYTWIVLASNDGGATWTRSKTMSGEAKLVASGRRTIDMIALAGWLRIDEHAAILPIIPLPKGVGLPDFHGCTTGDTLWIVDDGKATWIERATGKSGAHVVPHLGGYRLACAEGAIAAIVHQDGDDSVTRGAVRCTSAGCTATQVMLAATRDGGFLDVTRTGIAGATFTGRIITIEETAKPPRRVRLADGDWPLGFAIWNGSPSILVVDEREHLRIVR